MISRGASGVDAICKVRRELEREVPALIITGDTVDRSTQNETTFTLLYKPVRPVRLRSALSHLLAA